MLGRDKILTWIDDLIAQADVIKNFKSVTDDTPLQGTERETYLRWKLSCKSLLNQLFGPKSVYYTEFISYQELPKTHILGRRTEFRKFHQQAVEHYKRILICARDEYSRLWASNIQNTMFKDVISELIDNISNPEALTELTKIIIRRLAAEEDIPLDYEEAIEQLTRRGKLTNVAADRLKRMLSGKVKPEDKHFLQNILNSIA